jgi:hypothetical protein
MKKIFTILLILISITKITTAQIPVWIWAKSAGGSNLDMANSIATDHHGNTYITGNFYSPSITFGNKTLTNPNSNIFGAIYLVKYDTIGNVIWARKAIGASLIANASNSIAIDAWDNIYLSGNFSSTTITFETFILPHEGSSDIFLTKYNSNGDVIWARSDGGSLWDQSNSVSVDKFGNIFVSGFFKSSSLNFSTFSLPNVNGNNTVFLAKYDSNSNLIWAKSAGGLNDDFASSVVVDNSGNAYIAGNFKSATISFGTTTLTNSTTGNSDIFYAKYDPNGNEVYAKRAGGSANDYASCIALDTSGNIFITGYFFSPSISFGLTILTNYSTDNLFIAKFDTNGNAIWAKKAIGGSGSNAANSLAVDISGNAMITGFFTSSTITFDSNILTKSDSYASIFLAKYSTIGNVLWAKKIHGTDGDDEAYSIALDYLGNAYLTGWFNSTALSFDLTTLTNNTGNSNIFVAKIGDTLATTELNEIKEANEIKIYPNPTTKEINLLTPKKSKIEIFTIQGRLMKTIIATESTTTIDISGLYSGMYLLSIRTGGEISITKFIKE